MKKGRTKAVAVLETHTDSVELTSISSKPRYAQIGKVYRLSAEGLNQKQIAEACGVHQSTISRILAELKQTPEEVRAISRAFLPDVLDSAVDACKPAAARGDVTPHKFIAGLAHRELQPQAAASAQTGGGIVINIGAPGSPIRLPDIDVSPSESKQLEAKAIEIRPNSTKVAE